MLFVRRGLQIFIFIFIKTTLRHSFDGTDRALVDNFVVQCFIEILNLLSDIMRELIQNV
jgi:hypothetical protein